MPGNFLGARVEVSVYYRGAPGWFWNSILTCCRVRDLSSQARGDLLPSSPVPGKQMRIPTSGSAGTYGHHGDTKRRPGQGQAARNVVDEFRRQVRGHWLPRNAQIVSLEEVGLVQDGPEASF